MSVALLELAAAALGDLVDDLVFTGGATVGLWITDPAAPEPRPTEDVDVIVEVTSRGAFAAFEERLRRRRFRHDRRSGVIAGAPADLRAYVAAELTRHQAHWRYLDGIYAALAPDDASQARAERIVIPRIEAIITAG